MLKQVGPVRPFVDGFGMPFNPQHYWDQLRAGIAACATPEPPRPHVEPVWRDAPAGRSKCPPLHEDTEQGHNHWA